MHIRELFSLAGKTAIVTGGAAGIGVQISEALAEAGADIVIAARKIERCLDMGKQLEDKYGVRTLAVACDVSKPEDCENLVKKAADHFGRIDILVNNAGMSWGADSLNYPMDKWHQVMETNVTGLFYLSMLTARVMKEQGGGKIINIASIGGLLGDKPEFVDAIAYSTSKGAVITLTRDLAVKWARYGIYVNAICPGWFPTHMSEKALNKNREVLQDRIPLKRFGGENDLKGVIVLLSSAASDFITGQYIVVDGGTTASM
ncbi:SDR family oxidoreductase [Moorella sulfitireducens (nom. illeg.)]|uniref:SDR family oxidoreductase n=1 Tax=Neomoorella sulfitireducens TaxID=2972948 RepID=UPI0021AC2D30|nr:SDR family oxidoreductase [Moorella sulfitireducens]